MRILSDENWKYKIAFDNDLYRTAKRHSLKLRPKERELLDYEINFFRSYFSIEQIFYSLKFIKGNEQFSRFKQAVSKRIDYILLVPKQLKSFYNKKIENTKETYREFLNYVLDFALKYGKPLPMENYYKTVLGKLYSLVKRKCKKYSANRKIFVAQKKLLDTEINLKVNTLYNEIKTNKLLQGVWGTCNIPPLKISAFDEYGFGEWRSSKLTLATDLYTVYTNKKTLTDKELEHSFYLTVYPGTAHFLETLYNPLFEKQKCFDRGATYLINGWNMFSAWHIIPSPYTKNSKIVNSKILSFMMEKKYNNFDTLYLFLLNSFGKEKALLYLIELTQYRGRYESYILGGLATEILIAKGFALGPKDYLNKLKSKNIGNFLAIYASKEKVAKTKKTKNVLKKPKL